MIEKQVEEINIAKTEVTNTMNDKIEELKNEFNKRDELLKKKANIKPVPKLNLSVLSNEEDKQIPQKDNKNKLPKKLPIPGLKLGNIGQQKGYQEEFMEKEKEFSPSWRERLKKEKRF